MELLITNFLLSFLPKFLYTQNLTLKYYMYMV